MSNVVNLHDFRDGAMSGPCKCLGCGHNWLGAAEQGALDLECPSCGTWRGVFEGLCAPEECWECGCGNQHFYVSPHNIVCAKCGQFQEME